MEKMIKSLKNEDINILSLRHLYEKFGYVHYTMNKFEEYDLYVANKDFLVSDQIITFTDTDGKLLALKPDVTLSIVKSFQDSLGSIQKVYYDENVYRTSKRTDTFKEIMQMGLECMGDIDIYQITEVLLLAIKSLSTLSDSYILDLSHMGIIKGLMEELPLDNTQGKNFVAYLQQKNCHGIRKLFEEAAVEPKLTDKIIKLVSTYGPIEEVIETLEEISFNDTIKDAVSELKTICFLLKSQKISGVQLDLSIVNDMTYYNGVMFRGYINGIPAGVLSGGQYDDLMRKMKKKSGAIGFGINLTRINNYAKASSSFDVDAVLLYEPDENPVNIFEAVNKLSEKGLKVSAQKTLPQKLKCEKIYKLSQGGLTEIETDN